MDVVVRNQACVLKLSLFLLLLSGAFASEDDDKTYEEEVILRTKQEFVDALGYDESLARNEYDVRSRRDTGGLDIFGKIAAASGGTVVSVDKAEVLNHTDFSSLMLKNPVLIARRKFHTEPDRLTTFTFHSDVAVDNMTVQVVTSCCHANLTVIDPTGHVVSVYDKNINVTVNSTKLYNLWITRPRSGTWQINVTDVTSQDYDVIIQGSSLLNFELKFTNNRGLDVPGNPVSGKNDTYVTVTPLGDDPGTTWTNLTIMTSSGAPLQSLPLGRKVGRADPKFLVLVVWPNQDVWVGVDGSDKSGNPFTRQRMTPVQPLGIRLALYSSQTEMVFTCNTVQTLNFVVRNEGTSTTFNLSSTADNPKFTSSVYPTSVVLDNHETSNGTVSVSVSNVTTPGESVTLTITASAPDRKSQYIQQILIAKNYVCTTTTQVVPSSNTGSRIEVDTVTELPHTSLPTTNPYIKLENIAHTAPSKTTESSRAQHVVAKMWYLVITGFVSLWFICCKLNICDAEFNDINVLYYN